MKLADYENAILDFTETIQRNEKFYLAYYYKGICLESSGKNELAKEIYRKGLKVTPQSETEIISHIHKRLR